MFFVLFRYFSTMTPVCQSSSWLWHTVSSVIFNKVKLAGYYCVALTASSRANRLKDKIFWAGVIRTEIWAGKEPRPGKTWWEWEAGNWESFTQIITYLSPDWRGTKTPACSRLLQAASELFGWRRAFRNNEEFHWPPRQTGCYHQAAESKKLLILNIKK